VTAWSASGSNSVIRLLGSDGTTAIERDDNDGRLNGSSGIAGARIPTSGTYYLEVSSKLTQTIRPYDLWLDVRSGSPVQEAEPNDTEDTATPIGDGVVSGTNAGGRVRLLRAPARRGRFGLPLARRARQQREL
jgi:hypothetical protein